MGHMDPTASSSRQTGADAIVPIHAIGARHRPQIAWHLLDLDEGDRYLRFGYPASDQQVRAYVQGIDFERDPVFGIFDDQLQLVAMAHLALPAGPQLSHLAELGVSVAAAARGRGWGAQLFERAATHATNAGMQVLLIHALSENAAMLRIAHKAGAAIERSGSESQALLRLPAANLQTRMDQWMAEQVGRVDYWFKSEAASWRDALPGTRPG